MMRKIFFGSLLSIVMTYTGVALAAASSFVVTVSPDTFVQGEPVDLEIRAVDSKGDVITDFTSDIFFGIHGGGIAESDYTLPSDGYYQFLASDQGIKKFSKGLIIQKPGTYTLKVEDIYSNAINGETSLIVTAAGEAVVGGAKVTIASPSNQTVLDRKTTTLIGTTDSPRTPISLEINGSLVETEFTTDQVGGFSVPVTGLKDGKNTIVVQLRNAENMVLGASDALLITVKEDNDPLFQGFSLDPSTGLQVNDESRVMVTVASRVTSVSLTVDGAAYPLDRVEAGKYSGVISFQDPGEYELKLRLYVDGEMTEEDVDDIIVEEGEPVIEEVSIDENKKYAIGLIEYLTDPLSPGKVSVSWSVIGDVSPYYTIYYGTNPESLEAHMTVSRTGAVISGLPLDDKTYMQVRPSTSTGAATGDPSDPLVVSFQAAAPQCVVKGIQLHSEKRGSDYYLVWDAVKGAESYTIFRADTATDTIADMSVVGTTTLTEYKYPFDPDAAYEQFAYYAVQANCEGGINSQVGGVEKVKVGPVSSALVVLLLVIAIYFLYRVNIYNE